MPRIIDAVVTPGPTNRGTPQPSVPHFFILKKYHNTELVFDPRNPCVEESNFELKDCTSSEFSHIQGTEELPPNIPKPSGLGFIVITKSNSDHTYDTLTR